MCHTTTQFKTKRDCIAFGSILRVWTWLAAVVSVVDCTPRLIRAPARRKHGHERDSGMRTRTSHRSVSFLRSANARTRATLSPRRLPLKSCVCARGCKGGQVRGCVHGAVIFRALCISVMIILIIIKTLTTITINSLLAMTDDHHHPPPDERIDDLVVLLVVSVSPGLACTICMVLLQVHGGHTCSCSI